MIQNGFKVIFFDYGRYEKSTFLSRQKSFLFSTLKLLAEEHGFW